MYFIFYFCLKKGKVTVAMHCARSMFEISNYSSTYITVIQRISYPGIEFKISEKKKKKSKSHQASTFPFLFQIQQQQDLI